MFTQLIIGGILIGVTVLLQALCFDMIIRYSRNLEKALYHRKHFWKALLLTIIILCVTLVLIIQMWIWTGFYLLVDALPNLETALYFSISCFTTVGFGDVVLDEKWRLISSIESANGFLVFGWSTAFIFEIVSTVYSKEGKKLENR